MRHDANSFSVSLDIVACSLPAYHVAPSGAGGTGPRDAFRKLNVLKNLMTMLLLFRLSHKVCRRSELRVRNNGKQNGGGGGAGRKEQYIAWNL